MLASAYDSRKSAKPAAATETEAAAKPAKKAAAKGKK